MWPRASLFVLAFVLLVVACVAPPVQKKKAEEKAKDPEYARYLKQVIEILEEDDEYVQKLMNATEDELREGKVAEDIEFVKHGVRMKLDELKRQEIERQRMIRRQMNDHLNGIKEREAWNPLFDDENPNFFGAEDFKKLLNKVSYNFSECVSLNAFGVCRNFESECRRIRQFSNFKCLCFELEHISFLVEDSVLHSCRISRSL